MARLIFWLIIAIGFFVYGIFFSRKAGFGFLSAAVWRYTTGLVVCLIASYFGVRLILEGDQRRGCSPEVKAETPPWLFYVGGALLQIPNIGHILLGVYMVVFTVILTGHP